MSARVSTRPLALPTSGDDSQWTQMEHYKLKLGNLFLEISSGHLPPQLRTNMGTRSALLAVGT